MDNLNDLIYQFPMAALVLIVVGIFMRFIKERDEIFLQSSQRRDEQFLQNIVHQNDRTEELQKEMVSALLHVAVNEDRTAQVLTRLERKLDDDELKRETQRRQSHAS